MNTTTAHPAHPADPADYSTRRYDRTDTILTIDGFEWLVRTDTLVWALAELTHPLDGGPTDQADAEDVASEVIDQGVYAYREDFVELDDYGRLAEVLVAMTEAGWTP